MTQRLRNRTGTLAMRAVRRILFSFVLLAIGVTLHAQAPPADPAVANLLKQGQDALKAKHYPDAVKAFHEANKAAHDSCVDCWIGLATAQERMGDPGSATASAARAVGAAKTPQQLSDAHSLRGDIVSRSAFRNGQYDQKALKDAEQEYQAAMQANPNDSGVHVRLGILYAKQHRDEEAKAQFNKYLELAPNGSYVEQTRKMVANPRLARDEAAPLFSVETIDGQKVALKGS